MNRISFFLQGFLLVGLLLTTASFINRGHAPKPGTGRASAYAFVGHRWQLSSFRLEPAIDFDRDGKLDDNLLAFMSGCDRDNSIVFEPTGKILLSEETFRCGNGLSSNGKPGAWSYDKATRTIKISNRDKATTISRWEVIEASAKTLTLKTTVTENGKTSQAILNWRAM